MEQQLQEQLHPGSSPDSTLSPAASSKPARRLKATSQLLGPQGQAKGDGAGQQQQQGAVSGSKLHMIHSPWGPFAAAAGDTSSASGSSRAQEVQAMQAQGQYWQQQEQHAQAGKRKPEEDDPAPVEPITMWAAVQLLNAQFDGLIEGYAARVAEDSSGSLGPMTRAEHVFLQNNGELYDIVDGWLAGAWGNATDAVRARARQRPWLKQQQQHGQEQDMEEEQEVGSDGEANARNVRTKRSSSSRRRASPLSPEEWLAEVAGLYTHERCTAIVKVSGDLSDLLLAHATWDSFTQVGSCLRSMACLGLPALFTPLVQHLRQPCEMNLLCHVVSALLNFWYRS